MNEVNARSVRYIKLTYVGFRALVKIASRIVRRARLQLGWVTVFGRVYHLGL